MALAYPHKAFEDYEPKGRTKPSSNSFVEWLITACGVGLAMPPNAVGHDYFTRNPGKRWSRE
jgi:hypothetical protein